MTEVACLDLEDLLHLTRRLDAGPVRDVGLLDAACARPRATAFGVEGYADVYLKAAALLHAIAGNRAFVDGDKRLAWLTAVVFLDLNGVNVALSDDEAFDLVMRVAQGDADVHDIATALAVT